MTRNILLTIAYDGSCFHGWQRQPGVVTVQGHLESVISRVLNCEVSLNGAGRTDAGVHACGQRASFAADVRIPVERLAAVINNALCACERGAFAKAPARIIEAEERPEGFHARFDCRGKKYVYRLCCGAEAAGDQALVFEREHIYHIREELDVQAMDEAAAGLVGTRDFKSFQASGSDPGETTVRTIFAAGVRARQRESGATDLRIDITGDGFLYNMVRIITGTLIEVGRGRMKPSDMADIIEVRDRSRAGYTAPPYGLYLAEVYY